MSEQSKPEVSFAKAALVLFLIRMAAGVLVQLFPSAAAKLIGARSGTADFGSIPLLLRAVPLLMTAGAFLLCYLLVMNGIRRASQRDAQLALTVILIVLALNPVVGTLRSWFSAALISHASGASSLAAYSILNTAEGVAGLISSIAYPLLTAAAAISWFRTRENV